MQEKKRVVVTGYGGITPIGMTNDSILDSLKNGRSGVLPVTSVFCDDLPTHYAAEIKDFDPEKYMERKEVRKMDRFSQLSIAATKEAIAHSKINIDSMDSFRIGCIFGVGIGGMSNYESSITKLIEKGWKAVPVMTIPKIISNSASANSAMIVGNICGPNYVITTACSSGTDAIGAAVRHLQLGEVDVVITGGAEAGITRFGLASFNVLHALSTQWKHDPQRASRPFDKDRDGFVLGEGAAVLVLETLEHAQKRGATIYAEFGGYGNTCDAYHYTAPHPEGRGSVKAMQLALAQGGLDPKDIDYINAHGTSTPTNDPVETKAIKRVFGDYAYDGLKISSSKSMTGHCIGATGIIEAMVCVLSIEHSFIPPTINLENPDPECDLDYVPNKAQYQEVNCTMSNTLGFGGHNGVVIFKKYK